MARTVTHAQLIRAGKLWILGQRGRCKVALTELHCEWEIPDILAFRSSGVSVMVECKASRQDFQRDKKKSHRRSDEDGMGMEKWYLVGPEVVKDKTEIPTDWGHLEYSPSNHPGGYFLRMHKKATPVKALDFGGSMHGRERRMLITACARALEALRLTAPLSVWDGGDRPAAVRKD